MRKIIKFILFLITTLAINNLICIASFSANISIEPDINTLTKGEEFNLSLDVEAPIDINISTFRLRINFDETKLKYSGLYSNYGSDDFKTYLKDGVLTIIYLTSEKGVDIPANSLTSFLEISFKTLSSSASGTTDISAAIDGIGNYNVEEISSNGTFNTEINITDEFQANCNLKSIYAQGFTITPDFKPNITQYYVTVPSDVSSLEVDAICEDPSASVKVSRKKLNAAGKTTDINITVTGSDNKSRKIYKLTVLRSTSSDISSSDSKSPKSGNSSSKSSSSGSSGNNKGSTSTIGSSNQSGVKSLSDLKGLNVITSNFNFILFFTVCALCVGVAIFIIRKKSK